MKLILSPLAIKKLNKIGPAEKTKALKKIQQLKEYPLAGKLLKGELSNLRSIRAWPLRIIYAFDSTTQTIEIVTVDYRGSVYHR